MAAGTYLARQDIAAEKPEKRKERHHATLPPYAHGLRPGTLHRRSGHDHVGTVDRPDETAVGPIDRDLVTSDRLRSIPATPDR